MKANELMIGDLVRVNRDGLCIRKNTIVEIRGVDGDNKFEGLVGCASCMPTDKWQLFGGIWCDYLEPIPLTPEILEKNGWSLWEIEGEYKGLVSIYGRKAPFRILDCVEINYIHELQHALRLCGIEKEIVL